MKIIVGYDGSDTAQRALERAATLAGGSDQIVVVAAAEPHARSGITQGAHLDPSGVRERLNDLEKAKQFFSEKNIEVETIEVEDDPGSAIVEAAEGADLIIVGSRGLNPMQRLLLGSVSSKVVHRAGCDVLVVR